MRHVRKLKGKDRPRHSTFTLLASDSEVSTDLPTDYRAKGTTIILVVYSLQSN